MLFGSVKSTEDSNVNPNSNCAVLLVPPGETAIAVPVIFWRANPGLLSRTCSPGNSKIVVFSTISLLLPLKYENLADSIRAL